MEWVREEVVGILGGHNRFVLKSSFASHLLSCYSFPPSLSWPLSTFFFFIYNELFTCWRKINFQSCRWRKNSATILKRFPRIFLIADRRTFHGFFSIQSQIPLFFLHLHFSSLHIWTNNEFFECEEKMHIIIIKKVMVKTKVKKWEKRIIMATRLHNECTYERSSQDKESFSPYKMSSLAHPLAFFFIRVA